MFSDISDDDIEDEGVFMDAIIVPKSNPIMNTDRKGRRDYCAVCGAKSTGVNFDVLTCSSCKAFFRRNGTKPMSHFTCRLTGTCVIDDRTRRQCTACRLYKCFAVGMVKERIRSQEENDRHRALVEENRRQRLHKFYQQQDTKEDMIENGLDSQYSSSHVAIVSSLKHDNMLHINLLNKAFNESVQAIIPVGFRLEAGPDFSQFVNSNVIPTSCLIDFLKQIPHFQRLSVDSRLILLKNNVKNLMPIMAHLLKVVHNVPLIVTHPGFYDINNKVKFCADLFAQTVPNDARLLQLLIIVLQFCPSVFTINSPMDITPHDAESQRLIHQSYDYYAELLWFYIAQKSVNEQQSVLVFTKMITTFLRLQVVIAEIYKIADCIVEVDQLHMMMQSLFHIQ